MRVTSHDTKGIVTDLARIDIQGATDVALDDYEYSERYNEFVKATLVEIRFKDKLKITIEEKGI